MGSVAVVVVVVGSCLRFGRSMPLPRLRVLPLLPVVVVVVVVAAAQHYPVPIVCQRQWGCRQSRRECRRVSILR